jgi:transposase
LENAFAHFGGVPRTLIIDNLRAAVSRADWYESELNPKLRPFAAHYGTVIPPTRPRMPHHKGKVERTITRFAGTISGKHESATLEQACRIAKSYRAYRLRTVSVRIFAVGRIGDIRF